MVITGITIYALITNLKDYVRIYCMIVVRTRIQVQLSKRVFCFGSRIYSKM